MRINNGKTKKNILYNGKKKNCLAFEYVSKNDYVLLVVNFTDNEDEKFDLGMQFYGYYTLIFIFLQQKSNHSLFY